MLWNGISAFVGLMVLIVSQASFAGAHKTPAYWNCSHRIGGKWVFGQAPSACDASSFGDDRVVWSRFGPAVFSEVNELGAERRRYMQDMYAILRDASASYMRRRKPEVSQAEGTYFVQAVLALAHQESYWTHYRLAPDKRLKLMRGDSGHGHGMMQIDDRWHFVKVQKGEAWDLSINVMHALESFYTQWQRAAAASCVKNVNTYEARARAAYAAYNGGPGKLCRWTNSSNKWARNDRGYLEKLRGKSWGPYVMDERHPSPINISCLISGEDACLPGDKERQAALLMKRVRRGIPDEGAWVRIVAANGIMLRSEPGGDVIGALDSGEAVLVVSRYVANAGDAVHLQVEDEDGLRGYIYVGRLSPMSTVGYWIAGTEPADAQEE